MNTTGPIWISAGEASGDIHAASLLGALLERQPGLKAVGMGGPALTRAGCDVLFPMRLISLVGFTEVFSGLPRILKLLGEVKRALIETKPRAIILIDCPDFHFRVARMAKKLGIPVYYYVSPQVWAWRSGRVEFLRRFTRKVLCILPFERDFYAARGMDVDYVGHPLMDQMPLAELDAIRPDPNLLGLLPGSRRKEISTLLPEFAKAAQLLRREFPNLRVALARAPGLDPEYLRSFLPPELPVEIVEPDDRYRLMRASRVLLAASGTVTLEAALIGTPTVVAYRLSALSYAIGKLVIQVKWASLANLIMGREVFPELLQDKATAQYFAARLRGWIADEKALEAARADLAGLRERVGGPGAAGRAADIILNDLRAMSR
ncbi:MAG: lipid-A-disaccharide synthase [Humidesulfovibrio sp.]|uniref:lipid-A-disaccharide synthase n=1 Tax=Humidesulfovibrio sp. TaxID=2910988 RepID=UPI0027E9950C|nr:lipid-A-disaccharide synthase [Humidesulfovibrio sp.]MDQ7836641.1 lipid-A-disaccharide synthase [Humidesulfovibrio sp.]